MPFSILTVQATNEFTIMNADPADLENHYGQPPSVLVVDDEPSICWGLKKMLDAEGCRVRTACSAEEALKSASSEPPDLIVLDVRLPGMDGISALAEFEQVSQDSRVIIMTAFGDLETAVAAVRNKASDYLIKPFSLESARRSCLSALASHLKPAEAQAASTANRPSLIGQSAKMQHVFHQIALLADSDLSVLITGETGTGKELVAQAIHRYSHRSQAEYFAIAPVAFSSELVESELFGHVQGAFTGALKDQIGWFERAENGTILLDEIADLPIGTQVKLLRVIESGEFSRVGETRVRRCNVRILAATNCDLKLAVQAGKFREDLYFRLNGANIHLPPLRERVDDIPLLCTYFLEQLHDARPDQRLSSDVLAKLRSLPWTGNVRELKNAVQRAAILARGRSISVDDFSDESHRPAELRAFPEADVSRAVQEWTQQALQDESLRSGQLYQFFLSQFEPALLNTVLDSVGGNKARAAEILGIHRSTLRERLKDKK